MMKKKISTKKVNTKKNIIDMSERNQLTIGEIETYDVQELQEIIAELNKQIELIEKQYYSSNEIVEKISKRSFLDILREHHSGILSRLLSLENIYKLFILKRDE